MKIILESGNQLVRKSLPERIADTIEEWVFQGLLPPGERLKEAHLATTLGTSQSPVREALRLLEERGLVQHTRNRGTRVVEIDSAQLALILETRLMVEAFALEQARARSTSDERAQLKKLLVELAAAAKRHDLAAYHKVHTDFHRCVWALAHNPYLVTTLERLCAPLFAFYHKIVRTKNERSLGGERIHRPIMEWICATEFPKKSAREVMQEHFADVAWDTAGTRTAGEGPSVAREFGSNAP